jgi:hypothetical protein
LGIILLKNHRSPEIDQQLFSDIFWCLYPNENTNVTSK